MTSLSDLAGSVRTPGHHDKVFNEECIFSFDDPDSENGLFVCMARFLGFGRDHVEQYHGRTGARVFVRIKRTKVPKEADDGVNSQHGEEVPEKVSRMAIGVPGGFSAAVKSFDYKYDYSVVLLPEFKHYPIDSPDLPLSMQLSAKGIINAESALKKQQVETESATWGGEQLLPSKYASDLKQLDNGKKVLPRGWKCERCELTTNLWMNLTDGAINCGRRYHDGTGGNNHAVEHYQETKYPLAVKLGTITADGKADVYSYPEDNMVLDPLLSEHLAHFGIAISAMQKTDKSMAELEIDYNKNFEYSAITEAGGSALTPAYGQGLTGMVNLGNTCYMNSIMQLLFTVPSFHETYVETAPSFFSTANFTDPLNDFKLQMCKLGHSMWSGKYSRPPTDEEKAVEGDAFQCGVRPAAFKAMVSRGHPEFSTSKQQDAQEFFLYLCTLVERNHVGERLPISCMQFKVEDRIECGSSGKVKYTTRVEDFMPLPIPMQEAVNAEEVAAYEAQQKENKGQNVPEEEVVRRKIPFEKCLEEFMAEENIPGFYSHAIQGRTFAKKSVRLQTVPDYLVIQLKKFDFGPDWMPIKLDVEVLMPDEIDLSVLRGTGRKEGEEEMPEPDNSSTAPTEPEIEPDAEIVEKLIDMGFSLNGCQRAAVATKNTSYEAAVGWVMQHMDDPDFNAPLERTKGVASGFVPDPGHLATLMNMGMPELKSKKALRETDNNVDRAIDWIFSHPDDDGTDWDKPTSNASDANPSNNGPQLSDGSPLYELCGIVSHIGKSVHVGHYVCHVLKEGSRWVIFNDDKVAFSEKPPKTMGYLYLYRRKK